MGIGALVLTLFAACALLPLVQPHTAQHPLLSLLRVLFPSFRFFDDVAPIPTLYVRFASAAGELGPWLPALPCPARRLLHVFWNPAGNLHLAHGSLLEQLVDDLAERSPVALADAEPLTTFQMVACLARQEALRLGAEATRFQFKLRYGDPEEDVLISREMPFAVVQPA